MRHFGAASITDGGHFGPIGHDGVDIGRQRRERLGVLSRGNDQFGIDFGQDRALDIQIGPGVVGQQHFEFRHGASSVCRLVVSSQKLNRALS